MTNYLLDNSMINLRTTRPVKKAITGVFFYNVEAYETEAFVNARIYGESTGRALYPQEMQALKHQIANIVEEFNNAIANTNLSNEELQLAKIIHIYNHILKNVQYANVLPANDGTARVRNRSDDMLTPYESAYTALVYRKSICCGISDAFFLLCEALGIECEKWLWPDGGHAYNKVKIGNLWYKVDATFQIGFYPQAKAECWSDTYLLTATTHPTQTNESQNFPREQIARMKNFLERQGIDFTYLPIPKIRIRTTAEGLQSLVKNTSKPKEEQEVNIQNLQRIIKSIESILSPNPHITINNRTDQSSNDREKPTIYFTPTEKKISIQKINYKINIININDSYAVNIETPDNNQHTQVTNSQGKIIGIIKRGLEIINSIITNGTPYNNNPYPRITINSQNQAVKRYR